MKILYAINSAKRGGAEVHLLDLIKGFISLGHIVYVWCPVGEMAEEYKKLGAKVTSIDIKLDVDFSYIYKLYSFLKQEKIDVVHAHELKAVGNALIAAFLAKVKVRISHSHTPISEWKVAKWKKLINSRLFYTPFVNLFATREIALTESRKVAKVLEGIKSEKIYIIPNGLDLDKFTIGESKRAEFRYEILRKYNLPIDAYIFGNLGRLSVEKGLPVLIEAFFKFLKLPQIQSSNNYLMIIGSGSEYDKLTQMVRDLKLSQNIILPGEVFSEEDKIKYLSTFDCFVFPSLAEGFGIVLLEAMSMSIPIICSDLPVLQEVGGSSALLFETGNSQNLAEKMFNVYEKKDLFDSVKEDERKRVEDLYSFDTFIANYEELYISLMGGSL